MTEKVVGYILLIIGLLVIIFTLVNVYGLVTGGVEAFEIFRFDAISLDLSQFSQGRVKLPAELEEMGVSVEQPTGPSIQEIFPSAILNQTANFFIHLVILGFVASGGYKIASLGVQMTRPIVVNTSEAKVEEAVAKYLKQPKKL
ncbi:hypothetical protein ACFL2C_04395 [Patescibacteria group bacterium]